MSLKNLAKLVSNITSEKTLEEEFLFQYEQAVMELNKEKGRKPSPSYKPSSIGGCKRNIFFQLEEFEQDAFSEQSASNIEILDSGTDRHERIQRVVQNMQRLGHEVEWIDVEEYLKAHPVAGTVIKEKKGMETKVKNEILNISMMCDGVIKFKGKYYILEIKTEISNKFRNRFEPEEKHKKQASTYSLCLGINRVMFLYENRDFCIKKTYIVEVSPFDIEENVVATIEEVEQYREKYAKDKKSVPPMTEDSRECRYCKYKTACTKF